MRSAQHSGYLRTPNTLCPFGATRGKRKSPGTHCCRDRTFWSLAARKDCDSQVAHGRFCISDRPILRCRMLSLPRCRSALSGRRASFVSPARMSAAPGRSVQSVGGEARHAPSKTLHIPNYNTTLSAMQPESGSPLSARGCRFTIANGGRVARGRSRCPVSHPPMIIRGSARFVPGGCGNRTVSHVGFSACEIGGRGERRTADAAHCSGAPVDVACSLAERLFLCHNGAKSRAREIARDGLEECSAAQLRASCLVGHAMRGTQHVRGELGENA